MWNTWELPPEGKPRRHDLGLATLYVGTDSAGEGTVLTALVAYDGAAPGGKRRPVPAPRADDARWTRSFLDGRSGYEVAPAYPAIPVCVHLAESFSLQPGSRLSGWIFSRAEVELKTNGKSLRRFPLEPPRKTLFGRSDSGIVCRHEEAAFLASDEPAFAVVDADQTLVAHPVRVHNGSGGPIEVTELCFYGEQLSIFAVGSDLVSEPISFEFSASGMRMGVQSQGRAPEGSRILAQARVSGEERFIERSFELLRAMTRI